MDTGELAPLLEEFLPEDIPIWAVTSTRKNMSEALKRFIKYLSDNLPKSID